MFSSKIFFGNIKNFSSGTAEKDGPKLAFLSFSSPDASGEIKMEGI